MQGRRGSLRNREAPPVLVKNSPLLYIFPLVNSKKLCYGRCNTIEAAEAMKLREPAGWERGGGKSAEPALQAWIAGGDGGNTSVTVCGAGRPAVALSARMEHVFHDRWIRSPAILLFLR